LTTFLALYRGDSVSASKLLALTADPQLVQYFAARLLEQPCHDQDADPVLGELERGRQRALQLVKSGTE
jgi:hypothetical protein